MPSHGTSARAAQKRREVAWRSVSGPVGTASCRLRVLEPPQSAHLNSKYLDRHATMKQSHHI